MTAGLGSGRRARALWDRPSSSRAQHEAGFTLVEICITVWIMGALMVAFMGALFTMTKASDIARRRTLAEIELRHYAEAVRTTAYADCATTYAYTPATPYTSAEPINPTIGSILYWDGTQGTNNVPPDSSFVASCPSKDKGMQKITLNLSVGTAPNQIQLTTTIIKRRS